MLDRRQLLIAATAGGVLPAAIARAASIDARVRTGTIADELAREFPGRVDVIHRTGKRGLGRSYVEGFGLALQKDVVVVGA